MPQLLYPWERNLAVNIQARWAQGQSGRVQKMSTPPRFDPQTVWWLLASYCTDYASLAHTTTSTTTITDDNSKKKDDCDDNNEKCGMRFSQQ